MLFGGARNQTRHSQEPGFFAILDPPKSVECVQFENLDALSLPTSLVPLPLTPLPSQPDLQRFKEESHGTPEEKLKALRDEGVSKDTGRLAS